MAVCGLTAGLLIWGCARHTRDRVLSLLFDEPPGRSVGLTPGVVVSAETISVATHTPSAGPIQEVHPPFRDRRCGACHESGYSQQLRAPVTELCRSCHPALVVNAVFRHAPVEAGFCMGCHDPHQSIRGSLLLDSINALCHDCHEPVETAGTAHPPVMDNACTLCHDPHGGNVRFYLRSDDEGGTPDSSPSP